MATHNHNEEENQLDHLDQLDEASDHDEESKQKQINLIVDELCVPELMEALDDFGYNEFEEGIAWDHTLEVYALEITAQFGHKDELDVEDLQKMISFAKNKMLALSIGVANFDPEREDRPTLEVIMRGFARKLIAKT